MQFVEFPKIPRLKRDMVVTEKIDGTNAQIHIVETRREDAHNIPATIVMPVETVFDGPSLWYSIYAGSRNRWLWPGKATDNFGFAAWVAANAQELVKLGPGTHYGEWWGQGIQRGYGLDHKRFSLFAVHRWQDVHGTNSYSHDRDLPVAPSCCHVVPVLLRWSFDTSRVDDALQALKVCGSQAAKFYMNPEGVVVYHSASKQIYKQLLENDAISKTEALAA